MNTIRQLISTLSKRSFSTKTFITKNIDLYNRPETIIKNTSQNKSKIEEGFKGINSIGIIGWGSQAPAQTLNIIDSLKDKFFRDIYAERNLYLSR